MLAMFNLQIHVTLPYHCSSSSLDPVVTDFLTHEVHCSLLGLAGSSDLKAILIKIKLRRLCDVS